MVGRLVLRHLHRHLGALTNRRLATENDAKASALHHKDRRTGYGGRQDSWITTREDTTPRRCNTHRHHVESCVPEPRTRNFHLGVPYTCALNTRPYLPEPTSCSKMIFSSGTNRPAPHFTSSFFIIVATADALPPTRWVQSLQVGTRPARVLALLRRGHATPHKAWHRPLSDPLFLVFLHRAQRQKVAADLI